MSSTYKWPAPRSSRAMHPIPKSSHGHFVVQMNLHDSDDDPGRISLCGSLGEYRTRMIALAEPDTVDVIEQVGPLHWTDKEHVRHDHFLDHVVYKKDGRRLGLTDKPYLRVTKEFEDEIGQVCDDGQRLDVIDDLFLVTEFARDPVKLHNAELFRGCRDADPEVDIIAQTVAFDLIAETPIQNLVDEINRGPRGFRAVVRLIWSGVLKLQNNEKITHQTVVLRAEVENA
ncbi:MAG: hypothetical protein ACSHWZ_07335 [Sulfitobacter sp.]